MRISDWSSDVCSSDLGHDEYDVSNHVADDAGLLARALASRLGGGACDGGLDAASEAVGLNPRLCPDEDVGDVVPPKPFEVLGPDVDGRVDDVGPVHGRAADPELGRAHV